MKLQDLKEKKIVFFAAEIPPSVAGSGVNAYSFAKFLSAYTAQTVLCHLNYNNQFAAYEKNERLYINRLAYFNKNIITKILSLIPLLFSYLKRITAHDIIIVYSGYLIGYQFILLLSGLLGKKIIFRSTLLNGDDCQSLVSGFFLLKWLNKFSLGKISLYYSINKEFTKSFQKIFNNKVSIFESHQGVNIKVFHPVSITNKKAIRKKLGLPEHQLILITIGNLMLRKGYQLIYPQLSRLKLPFTYIVLGEFEPTIYHRMLSKEKDEMKYLYYLGQEQLGNKILFTGPVSNVNEYLFSSDYYIHGALHEGTPNALLEAMACGIPCIVNKLPGISGSLIKNNINAIEFHNHNQIPSIIENLYKYQNRSEILSSNASKKIIEKFNLEIVSNQMFEKLYA